MVNPKCEICGRQKVIVKDSHPFAPKPLPFMVCPATRDQHHIAELEGRLADADRRIEAQDLVIKANSLDGLRGLMEWALQQAKDAEAARAALKGAQP